VATTTTSVIGIAGTSSGFAGILRTTTQALFHPNRDRSTAAHRRAEIEIPGTRTRVGGVAVEIIFVSRSASVAVSDEPTACVRRNCVSANIYRRIVIRWRRGPLLVIDNSPCKRVLFLIVPTTTSVRHARRGANHKVAKLGL